MLYTEDFTMRHYVGFSQIRSHMIAAVEAVTPVMLLSLDQEISATQL